MSYLVDESLRSWLRLSLEPGLGPAQARALLTNLGLPEQIYDHGVPALAAIVGYEMAAQMAAAPSAALAESIDAACQWAHEPGNQLVTLADSSYPPALLQTHDPPLVLYVVGDVSLLSKPSIAIVGARSATPGGIENARAFARHLAAAGWGVISGLAAGIDAAAHEGALDAGPSGGSTVAVIATGANLVYPARNRALAHRIATAGAIVSELPLGTHVSRFQFPKRNRLVAGLSRGVLVVEAAVQSGSLITARLATELGRDVFAIPGSIHSPLSRGCHALIRQGAKLTETADDILFELGAATGTKRTQPKGVRRNAAGAMRDANEAERDAMRPPRDAKRTSGDATNASHDVTSASHDVTGATHDLIGSTHDVTRSTHDVIGPTHDVMGFTHDELSLDEHQARKKTRQTKTSTRAHVSKPAVADEAATPKAPALTPQLTLDVAVTDGDVASRRVHTDAHDVEALHAELTDADRVLHALGFDPVHVDDIQRRSELPISTVQSVLLQLELEGSIVRLEGGRYERRQTLQ